MDAHRSRSLGMAALIFILISLTAAVFHGAAPVRAEDATTPAPIEINGDTATVEVKLYTDENHNKPLGDTAVTSTSKLYGAFSARFISDKAPTPRNYIAVYELPDTIVIDKNAGGDLMEGPEATAEKAGTWEIKDNKVIFTFDKSWLDKNPAEIFVGANFSFELANKNAGSDSSTPIKFPGAGSINIPTTDGAVKGEKSGAFSQGADGVAKVTWTVKLTVESYATNVKLTDTLGANFDFVDGSFTLDGKKLGPQPTVDGQTVTIDNLGNLSQGKHTITYETVLKSGVSAGNGEFVDEQDASKNTATWEWGSSSDRQSGSVTAAPSKFRYDMIKKSDGSGSPSDISWTVALNQGELKVDMSGYMFTDRLDDKQTYTGGYTVYKGSSGSEVLATGALDPSQSSFSYTFPTDLADKHATYRIVYHTKMNDTSSYDTVRNNATIEREGSVSGASEGQFTPQLVGTPITKRLVSSDEAATTGRATWETRVALKAIVNAVNPGLVTVKDTFQSAWSQNLGVDEGAITIKIGKTVLVRDADWKLTASWPVGGTKRNFNLDIYVNDKVKAALENEDYAVITYATTSDALSGWYSNFASVSATGLNLQWPYTDLVMYVVNQETTPAVEKPEAESKVSWDEDFDWGAVDGSDEKGAWVVDWTVYANRQKGNKDANGEFEYYGAGKLNGAPLNIVDTLPDGMSYVSGFAKYTLVRNPYDQHTGLHRGSEAETVVDDWQLATDNVSSDGNTVAFSIPTTELGSYAGYAKLTYRTAVKRGELDTSKNEVKFINSASAVSGNKEFKPGSGTVTIKNNVIKKTGEQVSSSNRIKYTILVNESAVALKSGSDFLELVDVMDAKCTLVTDSVNVSQYDGTGWKLLGSDECPVSARTIEDENGAACTKMTLRVPDKEYLKVEYQVIPAGNEGETVSLSNKASLTGVYDGDTVHSKDWVIQKVSGSAGGSGYGVTITKVDESDITNKLPGAKFTLYEVNMDEALDSGLDSAKTRIRSAETDEKGTVKFGNATQKMEAYKLYCLEETKAPSGYNVISKPVWILLKGNDEDDYQKALAKAEELRAKGVDIDIPTASTDITVCDAPYSGQATISATKMLEGSTLQESQFGFVLKDKKTGKVLQTIRNGADGDINFVLDYTKMGIYECTISEVIPEGAENNVKDHITYDTTVHKVKVVVTNGEGKINTEVTYDNGSTIPPTFTNKYSTTLPEAGGAGLTMTYLAGASLLCFAATWMHARRHRDRDRGGSRE